MTQYYVITEQKEIKDSESGDFEIEDSEVFQTEDPDRVRDFISKTDQDNLFLFYLTIWSSDPKDWRSEILSQVNLELIEDPETIEDLRY